MFSSAIMLPLLVDGRTQQSTCANVQMQLKTQEEKYQPIANGTSIYRPINATSLIIRCQCDNGSRIPSWLLPPGYTLEDTSSKCLNVGMCIINQTLSFLLLKREHSGYYKCHFNSSIKGFILHVIGQL